MPRSTRSPALPPTAYLTGGGIASMAAAAFMIRDGDMFGQNITIFEESDTIGGSLDGSGSPEAGYVLRSGRMLESKYVCTFALFSSIPTLDESETVTQQTLRWNETMKTSSKSRLFRDGRRQTAPRLGLSEKHILTIERLVLEPESWLGRTTIAEQFDAGFLQTDFWFMWCTTFAFQPCIARSSSSATWRASSTWSTVSIACTASCGRSTTSMTRWCARCING